MGLLSLMRMGQPAHLVPAALALVAAWPAAAQTNVKFSLDGWRLDGLEALALVLQDKGSSGIATSTRRRRPRPCS